MKISKGTVIRTVMLFAVLINYILKMLGLNLIPTDESFITQLTEALISVGTVIASWWYNNSFSENAKKADEFFKSLKEN